MLKGLKGVLLPIVLFFITIVTTTLAGAGHENFYSLQFVGKIKLGPYEYSYLKDNWGLIFSGLYFSIPFISILLVHELGHYLTARYYKIKTSLPIFIPLYFPGIVNLLGTMGAIIKSKSLTQTRRQHFDVGVAGPIAGFVLAIVILILGFRTLPPKTDVFKIHPDYEQFGEQFEKHVYTVEYLQQHTALTNKKKIYSDSVNAIKNGNEFVGGYSYSTHGEVFKFGESLMWLGFKYFVAEDPNQVPCMYEIMHYPLLMAGYFALFFTALNLLPIGQLDGGHVIYGLFGGEKHRKIAFVAFCGFLFFAGMGAVQINNPNLTFESKIIDAGLFLVVHFLAFQKILGDTIKALLVALGALVVQIGLYELIKVEGYFGWMVFALIISRMIGLGHPIAPDETPLNTTRKVIGWIALIIFVLCFVPKPVQIISF